MKRLSLSIIIVTVLALSGCAGMLGTSSSTTPAGNPTPTAVTAVTGAPGGDQTGGAPVSTGEAVNAPVATDGAVTVYGKVVDRDTGQPFPKAWVRFSYLVSAGYEYESHVYTDANGQYSIRLTPGQYEVTGGYDCDLDISLDINGRSHFDDQVSILGDTEIDFVAYHLTGQSMPGVGNC
jgi:hypothetical protein